MQTHDSKNNLLRLSVRSADARIELAADAVIRKCLSALRLINCPLPIPIEEWIEHPLGYRLEIVSDENMETDVLGLARPTEGVIVVSDTLDTHEGRYRFTCAHELGHLVLHQTHTSVFRDGMLPSISKVADVEHEADRFAAAILMPVSTLALSFEKIRVEQGLDAEVFPMLRGEDILTVWLWRRCFLPALCDQYNVSRAAMAYRCRELRLPGQRRLVRPSLVPLLVAPDHAIQNLELNRISIVEGIPQQST